MKQWWLIPLILIYLGLAGYQLDLPGLHYDEAFEVVPTIQLLNQQPVSAFRQATISLFGTQLPLTTQDYIGALNTYGALPFLRWGGVNVISLRAYNLLVGVVTLVLVYGFTASFSRNQTAALAAVALLAVNPTFIFWGRQGIFVTAITIPIGLAAAWCWLLWWRQRHFGFALAGAFLLGLGLYAKFLFLWFINALLGAFILHLLLSGQAQAMWQHRCKWLPAPGRLLGKSAALLAMGALGALPLILYNLQTWGTLQNIGSNAGTSYYGVENQAMWTNLITRLQQLFTLLNSGHLWYLGNVYPNFIVPTLFIAALLTGLWLWWQTKRPHSLLPMVVLLLVTGQSIITISALWITHFAVVMVWYAIALVVTGAELRRAMPGWAWLSPALATLLAVLIISEGLTTFRYHQALTASGGLSDHSDAVYDLSAWLDAHADRPVVAMDWGLAAGVTFLTNGRVTPIEVFGYEWANTDRFQTIVSPHLAADGAYYLWRGPDDVIFDRSTDFKDLYRPLSLEEDIREAFYERSGRPLYGVTTLTPVGQATNNPEATQE